MKINPKFVFPIVAFAVGCLVAQINVANGQEQLPLQHEMILPEPLNVAPQLQPRHRQTGPSIFRFESVNYPGKFLRHHGYGAALHRDNHSRLFAKDSSFIVHKGLAGVGVSFESVNYPGYFLRHYAHGLVLHKLSDSQRYYGDATFLMTGGLSGVGTSLESFNKPGYYVRHFASGFRISKYECKKLFSEDASFIIR